MKVNIVLGLMFGDESKGKLTHHLATENSLVIRFSGGPQAGHTVEYNGMRHVFSSFGSGSLKGAETYWSKYCPFNPSAMLKELEVLHSIGINPKLTVDPLCSLITPYDIKVNRSSEDMAHGTCGHGVGRAIERTENSPYKLYAIDLTNIEILKWKYNNMVNNYFNFGMEENEFIRDCQKVMEYITIGNSLKNISKYDTLVFEGSQGIMLDMAHGYFPHVTRSNTTSKNALQLLRDNHIQAKTNIYYCMRSYLTRHGNGPMPHEGFSFEDQTNVTNPYQGEFRMGYHDRNLIKYAIQTDQIYSAGCNHNLVISHLDQTEDNLLIDNMRIKNFDNLVDFPIYKSIHNKYTLCPTPQKMLN